MRIGALILGIAALAVASIDTATARDGCGRGYQYDGYRCVPSYGGSGGGYGGYGVGYSGGYGGGYGGYGRGYSYQAPNFRGNAVRPVVGQNGSISCSNRNYTWQNGACRPYSGW